LLVGGAQAGEAHRELFDRLAASEASPAFMRPIYLRRGYYFNALCDALHQLKGDLSASTALPFDEVMVCGDIYELDLALPKALGAHVHLIERAAPFITYDYERQLVGDSRSISTDLTELIERVRSMNA
jgi:hypothetical protein